MHLKRFHWAGVVCAFALAAFPVAAQNEPDPSPSPSPFETPFPIPTVPPLEPTPTISPLPETSPMPTVTPPEISPTPPEVLPTPPPELEQVVTGMAASTGVKGTGDPNDYNGPVGVTGISDGTITTAGSYSSLSHSAHRQIDDIIVPGSVGEYPLKMTRYFNSRSDYYTVGVGFGPGGWTHEYSWEQMWNGQKMIVLTTRS